MKKYLTPEAIKWAICELKKLPKNQTALLFFLIFAKINRVDRKKHQLREEFETEFYKYFGGPIKGGGTCVYDPFSGDWRASEYINSTVYGRLLDGSHKWTEGSESFFKRNPAGSGWPATFTLSDSGFDNLLHRSSPPCLKHKYKLPLDPIVIYYFRFDDLQDINPKSFNDIRNKYNESVIKKNCRLNWLFKDNQNFTGNLFRNYPLSEEEMIECYPPSPFTTDPKSKELLFKDDIEYIKTLLNPGESVADFIHKKLIGENR